VLFPVDIHLVHPTFIPPKHSIIQTVLVQGKLISLELSDKWRI
jgi:hypothetical protein